MRPVSAKRARTLSRRRKNVQDREHGRPPCARQAICGNAADDLHEIVRRSQADSAARVDLQVWLCRPCHDWVGEHPAEAAAEGLHMTGATYRRLIADSTGAIVRDMPDTPPDEASKQIQVRLPEARLAAVDERAGHVKLSRNEWINRALAWALEQPVRRQRVTTIEET
jgi:hypothetical protein